MKLFIGRSEWNGMKPKRNGSIADVARIHTAEATKMQFINMLLIIIFTKRMLR